MCRTHDIAYENNKSLESRREADSILENQAWEVVKAKNLNLSEKAAAWAVTNAMKVKRKLGAGCGLKKCVKSALKKTRKNISRVIPIPKTGGGGLLPIFTGLSTLGTLTGKLAKVIANKLQKTSGQGLYLAPYKNGYGVARKTVSTGKIKKILLKKNKKQKLQRHIARKTKRRCRRGTGTTEKKN